MILTANLEPEQYIKETNKKKKIEFKNISGTQISSNVTTAGNILKKECKDFLETSSEQIQSNTRFNT